MKPRAKSGRYLPTTRIQTCKSGHRRYTSPRPMRGKFEHRVVLIAAIEETHPLTRAVLPEVWHSHHQDHKPAHNCIENLIMLAPEIHNAITAHHRPRCPFTGRFLSKEEINSALEWARIYDQARGVSVPVMAHK